MPRFADHEERRRLIADALIGIISARGLDATGVRDVAAAAGVTTGTIQHYFRSKNDMLLFALERNSERMIQRLRARAESAANPEDPRRLLRDILLESLPLDEERSCESRVAVAFLDRALTEPELAQRFREFFPSLRETLSARIRELAPDADGDGDAELLLFFVNGLREHLLIGQVAVDGAVVLLDRQLDRMFP